MLDLNMFTMRSSQHLYCDFYKSLIKGRVQNARIITVILLSGQPYLWMKMAHQKISTKQFNTMKECQCSLVRNTESFSWNGCYSDVVKHMFNWYDEKWRCYITSWYIDFMIHWYPSTSSRSVMETRAINQLLAKLQF